LAAPRLRWSVSAHPWRSHRAISNWPTDEVPMNALWLITCLGLLWSAAILSFYGSPLAFATAWLSLVFWPPMPVDEHERVERPATVMRDGGLLGLALLLILWFLDGAWPMSRMAAVVVGILARWLFLRRVATARQSSD